MQSEAIYVRKPLLGVDTMRYYSISRKAEFKWQPTAASRHRPGLLRNQQFWRLARRYVSRTRMYPSRPTRRFTSNSLTQTQVQRKDSRFRTLMAAQSTPWTGNTLRRFARSPGWLRTRARRQVLLRLGTARAAPLQVRSHYCCNRLHVRLHTEIAGSP